MTKATQQMMMWIGTALLVVGAVTAIGRDGGPTVAPALVGASGAVATVAQPFVEDITGVVTGVVGARQRVANSALINRALASGATLHLRGGTRIELGGSLVVRSGGGLVGVGDAKPVIYLPAAQFANRDNAASRYGASGVGISFSGDLSSAGAPSRGVRLENLMVESDPAPGRFVRGIVGQNVRDCTIRNVEVRGIPTGVGISLASARNCAVTNVFIHDFADRTGWGSLPQLTGIEIDNDLVGGVASSQLRIDGFRIEDLVVSGPLLAKWGYQTDGINILNQRSRVTIANGSIGRVGEGIDSFGSDGTIDNVVIDDVYLFGLKFIHGASRNRVDNVTISNAGLAGVTFSGSDQTDQDTAGNVISGLTIRNVDTRGVFRANDSAGVLIGNSAGARGKPRGNRVIAGRIDLGANGKYGWLDTSTGSGNVGSELEIVGGSPRATKVFVMRGGGNARLRAARAP